MAMRLSKRKRPPREEKMFKNRNLIASTVLDEKTIETLLAAIQKRHVSSIEFPISQGKEAVVFAARKGFKLRAVKVFKYETTSFEKNRRAYIEGDPRFVAKKSLRAVVDTWTRKEFSNLKICFSAGVPVPEPFYFRNNVLVMELVEEKGVACGQLRNSALSSEQILLCFKTVFSAMKKMFSAGLVHGDLSEYNILVRRGEPVIIDLGQAVLKRHPRAREFLERDVRNLRWFFEKRGVPEREAAKMSSWLEKLDWG